MVVRFVEPFQAPLERPHATVGVDGDQPAFPGVEESGEHGDNASDDVGRGRAQCVPEPVYVRSSVV